MYRFAKITNYYRTFLASCYAKHRAMSDASYDEQRRFLLSQRFGWSDYYSVQLRKLGVDAHELIANADPMQHAWAAENGGQRSLDEILFAQLETMKSEVVFLQDSIRFGGAWIDELRHRVPSVRCVIGWYCSPMTDRQEEALRGCDFILCCSPYFVEKLTARGFHAILQRHAFEPAILDEILPQVEKESDLVFIGSLLAGIEGHGMRQTVLQELIRLNVAIDLYINVETLSDLELFKRRTAYLTAHMLQRAGMISLAQLIPGIEKGLQLREYPRRLRGAEELLQRSKAPVFGKEMFRALASSRMVFNYHGNVGGPYAANIRLFEATGVGSCLVTDWKEDLHELFDIDSEIVAFRSAEECVEKVRWLVAHPGELRSISEKGKLRTLRHHTYAQRAETLHSYISQFLLKKG
jgi:spore maturation protein CgeB